MSEDRLRLESLSVLGGPLHGRRFSPEEVVGEVLIGSDSDCHLVLDLPTISPIHAKVWTDLGDSKVLDTSAPRGVYVNTERVVGELRIDEGDVLWLGPPQEPGSVCVKCHFKPWVETFPMASLEAEASPPEEEPGVLDEEPGVLGDELVGEAAPAPEPEAAASDELLEPAPHESPASETVPEDQAAEADPVAAAEPAASKPAAADQSAPSGEDDPFFVGETIAGAPDSEPEQATHVEARGQEVSDHEPAPVEPSAEPAPVAMSDDWTIAETPAEPEAAPIPTVDEFFVAAEPGDESAPLVPTMIEPEAEPEPFSIPAPVAASDFLDLPPLEPAVPPPPVAAPSSPAPSPSPRAAAAAPVTKPAAAPKAAEPKPAAEAPSSDAKPAARAPEGAEPKPPAAAPRAQPAAARRPASPAAGAAAARRPASTRPAAPAARSASGAPSWLRPVGLGAAGLLVVAALGGGAMKLLGGSLRLDSVEPKRVRVGQRATLSGSGFGSDPSAQTVVFGDREARVLQASPSRLEVEVPEAVVAAGGESPVPVVVRAKGRTTAVVEVLVFQGPRLHGISPGAAMPGEEVMLAGAGWGVGATVKFGSTPAQTLDVQPTEIRARVPEIAGGPGTEAAVIVTVAGVDSNPAPFILGHLPVLSGLKPADAGPGDVVSVSGRGFDATAARNDVRVGGVPALVIAASNDSLQMIVPRLGPGEPTRAVELRVPGTSNVGQAVLRLKAPSDSVEFRFIAEPFTPPSGHSHALLATGLGPAFVLAAAGGLSAAERAAVAADRLNAAAEPLRTTLGLTLEARGLDSNPVIGLAGRPETLLEVAEEDVAAYNEDWTGLRGRGGPVTRARLARWWEALGRDIVLLTIRGQAPVNTAALAPEGKVLGQLFEIATASGAAGLPRQVVDDARPPMKEGLRLLGLRVPPTVTAPAPAGATAVASAAVPAAAATPTPPPLQLEGNWGGSQVEQGQRQYLSVVFRGSGGSVAFEGGITFTVPMISLEKPRRDQVHFSLQIRGGVRHYAGQWDGDALSGNVSTDAAGKNVVATFELRRR